MPSDLENHEIEPYRIDIPQADLDDRAQPTGGARAFIEKEDGSLRLLAAPRHRMGCKASSDFGPLPSDVPSFYPGTRNRAIWRAYRNERRRSAPQIGCARRTCLTKCCTRSEP